MNKKILLLLVFCLVLAAFYRYIDQDYDKNNNTIYTNGNIITLESFSPDAEAMFVKNGIIEAIGTNEDVAKFEERGVAVIDLKGAIVLPGFIDPHTHAALSALMSGMVDLSGFTHDSNEEVWAYLKKTVEDTPAGEWIVCKGIDPVLVGDLKVPDLQFLDAIAPDNPVVLMAQSLHSYWLNSAAFNRVGIDRDTPDPSKLSYYERDKSGALTGLVVEQEAFRPVIETLKEDVLSVPVLTSAIANTLRNYALNGNTTIVSTGLTIDDKKSLMLFEHLSSENSNFVRKLLAKLGFLPERQPAPRHFIYVRYDTPFLLPENNDTKDDFYDIIGIKHWYDGSPYIGSMYLNEAYLNTDLTRKELHIPEGHTGKALIEAQTLRNFIRNYHNKGWQIAIHTQGDAAIHEVLNAFEEVNQDKNIRAQRHRLEHCLLLPEADIDKMKSLNITPSFHINHLYYYGDALAQNIIGEERADKILPVGSTQEKSIPYSLHADQPMFDSKPFRLMQTAVERSTKTGNILGSDQHITHLQALEALTIHAAWQIHREDKIGSLKVGKYADFIIVDKNPLEVPTNELENIKILKTYINGNEVK